MFQKSLKTNKQRKKASAKDLLWFSTVARAKCDRWEQLPGICPMLFSGRMEAEHLSKAKVPSVHLLASPGLGFFQHQHLFLVEFINVSE